MLQSHLFFYLTSRYFPCSCCCFTRTLWKVSWNNTRPEWFAPTPRWGRTSVVKRALSVVYAAAAFFTFQWVWLPLILERAEEGNKTLLMLRCHLRQEMGFKDWNSSGVYNIHSHWTVDRCGKVKMRTASGGGWGVVLKLEPHLLQTLSVS